MIAVVSNDTVIFLVAIPFTIPSVTLVAHPALRVQCQHEHHRQNRG
jgi:hypothetical protein